MGKKNAVVIGAGIFGVSATKMLSENDYSITLIDTLDIGQGTTSQSTEMIRLHHFIEHEFWCTNETLKFIKENGLLTNIPYLFAYYDKEEFQNVEIKQKIAWEYNNTIDIKIENQEESLKKYKFLRKQVKDKFLIGTSTCQDEGRVDVNLLIHKLLENCDYRFIKDKVVHLDEQCNVYTLKNNTLKADKIIVAAGPWTGALLGACQYGDFIDIVPTPYYTFKTDGKKPIPYMLVLPDGLYLHPEHPDLPNFAVGGISKEPSFTMPEIEQEERGEHINKINQYLQSDFILDHRCQPLSKGCYDITPNHTLLIKQSVINSNIYAFAGGNGHGIMMSIGASMLLEEFIGLKTCEERKKILKNFKESANKLTLIL